MIILCCSSEPFGHIVDDEENASEENRNACLQDGLLTTFEDHEESVYVAAWSSADPSTIASLSYDGRLVINQVPRDIKFKILNCCYRSSLQPDFCAQYECKKPKQLLFFRDCVNLLDSTQ